MQSVNANDIIDQFEKYLHFINISPDILPWRMQVHDNDITLEQGSVFDKQAFFP